MRSDKGRASGLCFVCTRYAKRLASIEDPCHGENRSSEQDENWHLESTTRASAAKMMNVSGRTVDDAAKVIARSDLPENSAS